MIERMRFLCRQRGTNFKKVEAELHLGNGSLAKSSEKTQCGRLKQLADYFGVSMEYLMTGVEPVPAAGVLLTSEEQHFLEYFHKLNKLGKQSVMASMEGLTKNPAFVVNDQGEKLA